MSSKMDDGTPVITEIENRMRALGYNVCHHLVKASNYGVPQNRFRLLIIGIDSSLNKTFDFDEMDCVVNSEQLPSVSAGRPEKLLLGSILQNPSVEHENGEFWPYTDATQAMVEQIGPCAHGDTAFKYFTEDMTIGDLPEVVFEGRSWKDIPYELLKPRFKKIALSLIHISEPTRPY